MSKPTKTELMTRKLEKLENVEDMKRVGKAYAEEIGCAKSLVYKVIKRIMEKRPEDQKALPESREPVVKISKPEEVEVIEAEGEEEEIEEPEIIEPEELEELEEEEKEEVTEEQTQRLGDIFVRSIGRILNIPVEQKWLSEKLRISQQEADDTAFLALLFISKYTEIEAEENMLEIVTATHVGSLTLRAVIAWWKEESEKKAKEEEEKKEAEKRAEREKAAQPSEPEKPEKTEPETVTTEERAKRKAVEPSFMKEM